MKDYKKNKIIESIGAISFVVGLLVCIGFFILSLKKDMEIKQIAIYFSIGIGALLIGTLVALICDYFSGIWFCPKCGAKFKPKFKQYLFAYHTPTKRLLTCPECHEKVLCEKHLSKKK